MNIISADSIKDSSYYRKDDYFLRVVYFVIGNALEIVASPMDPTTITVWDDSTSLAMFSVHIHGEVEAFETITVPAGIFNCYRERLEVSIPGLYSYTIRNWLADGIGAVRIVSVSGDDSTDMKLESYSLH